MRACFGAQILLVDSAPGRWHRRRRVPEISRFHGIVVGMFHREHGVAHFHAVYGGHKMSVEIESGRLHGELPVGPRRLVLAWAALHKAELLENWRRARDRKPLARIAPLE